MTLVAVQSYRRTWGRSVMFQCGERRKFFGSVRRPEARVAEESREAPARPRRETRPTMVDERVRDEERGRGAEGGKGGKK